LCLQNGISTKFAPRFFYLGTPSCPKPHHLRHQQFNQDVYRELDISFLFLSNHHAQHARLCSLLLASSSRPLIAAAVPHHMRHCAGAMPRIRVHDRLDTGSPPLRALSRTRTCMNTRRRKRGQLLSSASVSFNKINRFNRFNRFNINCLIL
jgi:hypothetical protein